LLLRFKVGSDVDLMMDGAPYMIESRLREIIDYIRHNPSDVETMDYAKSLIDQLSEFDRALAMKYARELGTLTKPVTKVVEPVHVVKPVVFKQRKPSKLRKVLVGLLTVTIGLVSIPLLVVYTIISAMRWL